MPIAVSAKTNKIPAFTSPTAQRPLPDSENGITAKVAIAAKSEMNGASL